MKMGKGIYVTLGAMAAVVLAVVVAIGYLGHRMPQRDGERLALGKPLSEQQETARRRGTIAAAGAVTAMAP